jgi:hypothetical protein
MLKLCLAPKRPNSEPKHYNYEIIIKIYALKSKKDMLGCKGYCQSFNRDSFSNSNTTATAQTCRWKGTEIFSISIKLLTLCDNCMSTFMGANVETSDI